MLTRLVGDFDLDFEWRGFELHPRTPRGGMPLARLYPQMDWKKAHAQLVQFARTFGVDIQPRDRLANTRRALALAEHARDAGKLDALRDAVMDAYWRDGRDIEADDVLRACAAEAGLDADAALAAADAPAMQARVDAMGDEARAWGVTGIPTYFLLPPGWSPGMPAPADGTRPVKIVGCQPWDHVVAGCMRAGVARRA